MIGRFWNVDLSEYASYVERLGGTPIIYTDDPNDDLAQGRTFSQALDKWFSSRLGPSITAAEEMTIVFEIEL